MLEGLSIPPCCRPWRRWRFSADGACRCSKHKRSLNTCHIWDEDGDHVRRIEEGIPMEAPVWVEKRMAKLGRSTDEWQRKRI